MACLYFLNGIFWKVKVVHFDKVWFTDVSFIASVLCGISKKKSMLRSTPIFSF